MQAVVLNELAPQTIVLADLEEEVRLQQARNSQLHQQILKEKSLGQIEVKARRMGFIDGGKPYIVKN